MTDPSIDDAINGLDELTLSRLFRLLGKLKIKVLISIITIFIAYSIALFQIGEKFQIQTTAIPLDRPFGIKMASIGKKTQLEGNSYYEGLTLVKSDQDGDKITFKLRQRFDPYTTKEIGGVITQSVEIESIFDKFKLISFLLPKTAYALDWQGHETSISYKEESINARTIRRTYDDEWILEYKVDEQGTSIPESFVWIKGNNSSADAEKGKDVFDANCAGCHSGGTNINAQGKSLSKEDLVANNRKSAAAIINLVTNGATPMPAFGDTINAADIEDVAAYVLKKADAGW